MTVQQSTEVAEDRDREVPPSRRATRAADRRRQARVRRILTGAFLAAVALCAASIPVLGYIGVRAVLDSSDGEIRDPVLDPDEPGYQALVPASPTLLVLQTDDTGGLVGAALLALADERDVGGSVLLIPTLTLADLPDIGRLPIEAAFAFNGPEAAKATAARALQLGIDEVVVVGAAEWADILAPAGSLPVTNPDVLRGTDGVVFPAGELELAPTDVPRFAAFVGEDENRLNRLLRQELVWRSWLELLESDPAAAAFPGEQERGLARFVTGIVSGGWRIETLPVVADGGAADPTGASGYEPDREAVDRLVPQLVPFPTGSAIGERPRVRVLAGTPDRSVLDPAIRRTIEGGAHVVLLGNADRLDYEVSEILYFDPAMRDEAESVAEALGFGTVIRVEEIDDSADITVVLGADADL